MWGIYPLLAWYVVVLVFLEGLLSADNALVLAVMVRPLPKAQQKRALHYGIVGAFAFRVIAVLLSSVLLHLWYFKVIGGGYLLYLAIHHFASGEQGEEGVDGRPGRGFWATVVAVELADIAFSIDSILAAVAMAEGLPPSVGWGWKIAVVITGGVLGIITMRYVAGTFLALLDRFPGLANGAYYLVAWIGVKLILSGLHATLPACPEMPEWLFWGGMVVILAASLVLRRKKEGPESGKSLAAASQAISEAMEAGD